MTKEQQKTWGILAIVFGVIIGFAAINTAGRNRGETAVYDSIINSEIDRRNGWSPGTSDEMYGPSSTEASTGVLVGCFAGIGLVGYGIWLVAEANKKAP